MRLLFIRHGDPDYKNDALTEKGRREAKLLADRMERETVRDFYVSPLGRARETADYTLSRLGRTAQVRDWLREFPARIDINDSPGLRRAYPDTKVENGRFRERIVWDMLPGSWQNIPEYYDRYAWRQTEVAESSNMAQAYETAVKGLDGLLAEYGYIRKDSWYRTEKGNNDTICFFCHLGITCVFLSHLWGISPFLFLHCMGLAPTSVTEVYTEEREKGIVSFRASKLGDISHLYAANEPPSPSSRFCQVYENWEERH